MKPKPSPRRSLKWYQRPVSEFQIDLQPVVECAKNRVAWALMILVPMLIGAIHLAALSRQAARLPPHLTEIINEISAIRIPTGKVVPNHANTKVLYLKYTTNDTWAVYLLDIPSKRSWVVEEIKTVGKGRGEFGANRDTAILGWSPRDEYFAYATDNRREIVICDGVSGSALGKANIAEMILTHQAQQTGKQGRIKRSEMDKIEPVSSSAWLSSRSLLCANDGYVVELSQSPGGWDGTLFHEASNVVIETNRPVPSQVMPASTGSVKTNRAITSKTAPVRNLAARQSDLMMPVLTPPTGEIKSLTAYDFTSALWQQSDTIYFRQREAALKRVWQATNCTLKGFSYSDRPGKFLLHCQDAKGDFLGEYYFPPVIPGDASLTNVVRLDLGEGREYDPAEVQMINQGKGYAYLNKSDLGMSRLVIKVTSADQPVELPWTNHVTGFSISGLQLFGITSNDREPPGIWQCNLATRQTERLVSSIDHPFKYAANVPVLEGCVTNSQGERLTYYLLQPAETKGDQKNPLVVGNMGGGELGNTWDRWAQIIANSDAYFLCMDRRKRNRDQWAEDVFCAYEFVSKNFCVDTNKLYLVGVSAGADTARTLLETKPGIWKGAFFISTPIFPSCDQTRQTRLQAVVVNVGGKDGGLQMDRLVQTQDRLAAGGIRPILVVHPGVGHVGRSVGLERKRMEQISDFIHQP